MLVLRILQHVIVMLAVPAIRIQLGVTVIVVVLVTMNGQVMVGQGVVVMATVLVIIAVRVIVMRRLRVVPVISGVPVIPELLLSVLAIFVMSVLLL